MVCCLFDVKYILSFCVVFASMVFLVFRFNAPIPVPNFAERNIAPAFFFIRLLFLCSVNRSSLLYMVIVSVVVETMFAVVFIVGSNIWYIKSASSISSFVLFIPSFSMVFFVFLFLRCLRI